MSPIFQDADNEGRHVIPITERVALEALFVCDVLFVLVLIDGGSEPSSSK